MRRIIITIICGILVITPVFSAERTTPVVVRNPIEIDSTQNTVQSQQSGTWNVGITGTPNVNVANSPTVKIDATTNTVKAAQSGTWNVGITGTPSVGIDSTNNTVKALTQSKTVQLWTSSQTVSPSKWLFGPLIDCTGYKEIRVSLFVNYMPDYTKAWVYPRFLSPAGYIVDYGLCNFAPSNGLVQQANYTSSNGECLFLIPVMSNQFSLSIFNASASDITIQVSSFVYLVN